MGRGVWVFAVRRRDARRIEEDYREGTKGAKGHEDGVSATDVDRILWDSGLPILKQDDKVTRCARGGSCHLVTGWPGMIVFTCRMSPGSRFDCAHGGRAP